MMPHVIKSFTRLPLALYRVNNGITTKIRERSPSRTGVFDIITKDGNVFPRELHPSSHKYSNGASLLLPIPKKIELVRNYKGRNVNVFALHEGLMLPAELILFHDKVDHYSLEPAQIMSLIYFNKILTHFFNEKCRVYKREEWLEKFGKDQ